MTFSGIPIPTQRPNLTSTMPSNDNIWGRRTSMLPSLSWKKSSEIEIVLDGENEFIHSYSTFDVISGHVNLKFEKDTCIDDLMINFQGTTTTWIEKIATASPTMGRTTGKHVFLRVRQPIDENCLPEFNKALAGQIYTIPFKFVVPDKILDFICSHKVDQDAIRDQHLQLPPSMGNPMLAGKGNTLMDDLSPVMAKIVYCIRVTLLKASPSLRKPEMIEEEVGVRIVPAREELPPISVDHLSATSAGKYCLRKEKNVRKGIFKMGKKQGKLTAETLQPASLKLHPPSREVDEPIATMTTVQLRFDPASEEEQPPALNNMTNKLRIHTFFGASAWNYFPVPDGYDIYSTLHSQYPETIDLSTRNLSNVEWVRHEAGAPAVASSAVKTVPISSAYERRSSKVLSCSIPSSAGTHGSRSTVHGSLSRRASTFSNASSNSSTIISDEEADSNDSSSGASSSINLSQTTSPGSISPSEAYNPSLPYYTTSIVVPITLPTSSTSPSSSTTSPATSRRPSTTNPTQGLSTSTTHKPHKRSKPTLFIPSFHSCLVSRVYALDLSLSAHSTPTINLRVPLQISLPYPDRNTSQASQNSISNGTSEYASAPPAWSDPFSTSTSNEVDMANDEALARALSQSYDDDNNNNNNHLTYQAQTQSAKQRRNTTATTTPLDDVPEYEATMTTSPHTRHLSIAIPPIQNQSRPAMNDDLPPEYNAHNSVRRVSAARRAAASSSSDSSSASPSTAASQQSESNSASNQRRRRSGFFSSIGSSSSAANAAATEGGRVSTSFPRKSSMTRGFNLLL